MVRKLGFKVNHLALDDVGAQKRLGQYDWDMNAMHSGPRADMFLRFVRLMSDGPNPTFGAASRTRNSTTSSLRRAQPDLDKRRALYLEAKKRAEQKSYF